jgi:hypothetical protein
MSDSIREQIVAAIVARLAIIRTANGFATDLGAAVYRAARTIGSGDAVVVFPRREEAIAGQYGAVNPTMPVEVQGVAEIADNGSETEQERAERVSKLMESMLADIIEAMTGDRWSVAFTSGSREPVAGETIEGATSEATGFVESVAVTSGSWSGGDAAGTIKFRRRAGTFAAENLDIGSTTNVCTINGTLTRESAIELATGDLAEAILYAAGGADDYPEPGDRTAGVAAVFNVVYSVRAGDPFGQPT